MTNNVAHPSSDTPPSGGVLIKFYRRLLSIPEERDLTDFKYIVWGYFDWIKVESGKKTLHELFINSYSDSGSQQGFEEQILCVYPPVEEKFLLDDFSNGGNPLLVITEIKIFEKEIQRLGLDSIKKQLEKKINESQPDFKFQIVYSLGYSDLVIIFCGKAYEPIIEVLLNIKKEPEIKSIYSIHGMDKFNPSSWNNSDVDFASVFISLKPEAQLSNIATTIKNELEKSKKRYDVEVYPLLGKYDLELRITPRDKDGFPEIARLFLPRVNKKSGNILYSSNTFFLNNINYTRTRWISKYKSPSSDETIKKKKYNGSSISNKEFEKLWALSQSTITKQIGQQTSYPQSLTLALQDVLKYYWQIKNNETASPLLQNELFKLISALYKTIDHDIQEGKDTIDVSSLELSVHLFSDLLQNWVQATRMVFEGPNYNLKFINSSTKIFISYFAIIEIIEKSIENLKVQGTANYSKFIFFPTISFTDLVKSHFLFPKSSYSVEKLIPIQFDKVSFFSPSQSIPWLLHEMGHYLQSSQIKQRNNTFLQTVIADVSRQLFMYTVVGNENPYLLDIYEEKWAPIAARCIAKIEGIIHKALEPDLTNALSEPDFSKFAESLSNLVSSVFCLISPDLQEYSENLATAISEIRDAKVIDIPSCLMYENLTNWLFDSIRKGEGIERIMVFWKESHDFTMLEPRIKNILDRIYEAYIDRRKHYDTFCKKIGQAIFTSLFFGTNDFFDKETVEKQDSPIQILEYANYFAKQGLIEFTPINEQTVTKKIQQITQSINLIKEISLYQDFFQETAADLFMIKVLDLSPEEYIKIIDIAVERLVTFYTDKEVDPQSILMRTREDILLKHYYHFDVENHIGAMGWQSKVMPAGFYDFVMEDYLLCLGNEFDALMRKKEMVDFKENYKALVDVNNLDDSFMKEIRFIEKYWKLGLEFLDGKGK